MLQLLDGGEERVEIEVGDDHASRVRPRAAACPCPSRSRDRRCSLARRLRRGTRPAARGAAATPSGARRASRSLGSPRSCVGSPSSGARRRVRRAGGSGRRPLRPRQRQRLPDRPRRPRRARRPRLQRPLAEVGLPIRPNGVTGWVRAAGVDAPDGTDADPRRPLRRRVTLFRDGRPVLAAPAAVGAPATPTPTGSYYVNQRLDPRDVSGPVRAGRDRHLRLLERADRLGARRPRGDPRHERAVVDRAGGLERLHPRRERRPRAGCSPPRSRARRS